MENVGITIGVTALLLILMALGMPIAFALGLSAIAGLAVLKGWNVAAGFLASTPYTASATWALLAIPLFIYMGDIAAGAGITKGAYRAAQAFVGWLPGGLAITTVIGCAFFGACTGSSAACAATVGKIALPEMRKYGYDKGLATGTVAAGGLLALLIPPSIPLVIYGMLANVSIGAQLLAGFLPGVLTAVIFCTGILILVKVRPSLASNTATQDYRGWKAKLKTVPGLTGIGILFLVIIGGIYSGIFTATESAAVAVFAAFLMLVIARGKDRWHALTQGALEAAITTGMLFMIIIGARLLTLFLTYSGLPQLLVGAVATSGIPRMGILLLILAMYIPLGMFLDSLSMMFLTLPLVAPIVQNLGFDLIWFGILVVKMIEIGQLTPPVASNVFVLASIAPDIPVATIYKGVTPFIVMEVIVIAILLVAPQIALWLPQAMRG